MEKNHNPFKKQAKNQEEIKNENIEKNDKKELETEIKDDTISNKDIIEEQQEIESKEEKKDNSLEEKYNELNNTYIRLAADFDNYRKRTQQEKEALSAYAAGEVLSKLTGVLDTFERAKESLKNIEDCKTVKESYEVAYKQLSDTLTKLGMVEIEALGQPFDPNFHEAVTQIPTNEFDPDTVAVVMQKGYKIQDRVLRPALVGVAKPIEQEN